jgi:hypothetical protein
MKNILKIGTVVIFSLPLVSFAELSVLSEQNISNATSGLYLNDLTSISLNMKVKNLDYVSGAYWQYALYTQDDEVFTCSYVHTFLPYNVSEYAYDNVNLASDTTRIDEIYLTLSDTTSTDESGCLNGSTNWYQIFYYYNGSFSAPNDVKPITLTPVSSSSSPSSSSATIFLMSTSTDAIIGRLGEMGLMFLTFFGFLFICWLMWKIIKR